MPLHAFEDIWKSLPACEIANALNAKSEVPVSVIVTLSDELVVLMFWLGNTNCAGDGDAIGNGFKPVPFKFTTFGVPVESVMVIVPLRVPEAAGLKYTEKVQFRVEETVIPA